VEIDAKMLEVGNHAGATFEELRRFSVAALGYRQSIVGGAAEVSLEDGAKAVLMGVAAQRSIETGEIVIWKDALREYEAHLR